MYTCIILHNMVINDEGKAMSLEYISDPLNDDELLLILINN